MSQQEPPAKIGGEAAPPLSESSPAETGPVGGTQMKSPDQLEPGRGAPLAPGAPKSVSPPVSAGRINGVFGIGGLLGILVIIVVVVLVGLLLVNALSHH